ncbi:PH domain-containing protein [Tessaracoccus antarcticus]|uniref:PH domain-containing protein n=1 Tax=Tessaracoccus antarcticus TaxID=2479848 RepID=A0A3M0G1N4_9ACTN|nr:PH domain-containing protein [Tessaracoccus antarcticus]RMB58824.1 PH domain-containing protein [Tessaracoccus antarcticus]
MGFISRLLEPDAHRHLIDEEGEVVVEEVHKHWAATFWWYVLMSLSIPLFISMVWAGDFFWLPLAAGLVLLVVSMWKCHVAYMDRFVITNMRVFRIHGIFNQNLATVPLARILDISMTQTLAGQLCGYGHFIFESAAQDQGLKIIRYVGDPTERDLIIQRTISRAGLRGNVPHPVRPAP